VPAPLVDDALTIFLLHGVADQADRPVRNYTGKHLSAERFSAFCRELLDDGGVPMTGDAAVAALTGEAELPPRAFLLSFDDGFRNNLTVAAPILQALGIGAVFYVTTRFVDEGAASWIDLIEDAVDRTREPRLPLPWGERPTTDRIGLLDEIRREVKSRGDLDPYEVAESVIEAAGTGAFRPDPELDAKLSWHEVRVLDALPGCTVGGHSHTHRILSHLSPEELAEDLDRSFTLLDAALGRRVRHYSYPEGLAHCYSDVVIAALRERGVVCCPTAEPGVNRVGDDLFRLRRVEVA
jgi:peptidoglycan/xylan/chitin deacetylase (PgdA/CDA1 family)